MAPPDPHAATMHPAADLIACYIRAKDENRPHLMTRVFAEDAIVNIVVNAGSLSFPATSNGIGTISDVLVRRFAQAYENVYTLCLAAPPRIDDVEFSCRWLVGMSEKESRIVRVGCGRYDWLFRSRGAHRVERLTITIEAMQSLAPDRLSPVLAWLSSLPYPWCSPERALAAAPAVDGLGPVLDCVARRFA